MQTIKIQEHTRHATYQQPHFFIQSKGYNAGRPSSDPYNNSYVVLVTDELEKGMIFWICFALWKANRFLSALDGFPRTLNIPLTEKLIGETCKKLSNDPRQFLSNVKEMKELIQTEKLLSVQSKLIKKFKVSVARKLLR